METPSNTNEHNAASASEAQAPLSEALSKGKEPMTRESPAPPPEPLGTREAHMQRSEQAQGQQTKASELGQNVQEEASSYPVSYPIADQGPTSLPQQHIIAVEDKNKHVMGENVVAASVSSFFLGLLLTPVVGLVPLAVFSRERTRAYIILWAGIGGIAWTSAFTCIFAIYRAMELTPETDSISSRLDKKDQNENLSTSTTVLLFVAILFFLVTFVMILAGVKRLNQIPKDEELPVTMTEQTVKTKPSRPDHKLLHRHSLQSVLSSESKRSLQDSCYQATGKPTHIASVFKPPRKPRPFPSSEFPMNIPSNSNEQSSTPVAQSPSAEVPPTAQQPVYGYPAAAQQPVYYPQPSENVHYGRYPLPSQQPVYGQYPAQVIVIQPQTNKNDDVVAGILGGCLGFWLTPCVGISPLCCFKEARTRAIIVLAAGIGGISWAVVFLYYFAVTLSFSDLYSGTSTRITSSGATVVSVSPIGNFFRTSAIVLGVLAGLLVITDVILITLGIKGMRKQTIKELPQQSMVQDQPAPAAPAANVNADSADVSNPAAQEPLAASPESQV
ncbi:MAG: hypothetical protein SGCHY_004055 [Lobulomycetales sp.]